MRSLMKKVVLTTGAMLICAAGTAQASTTTVLRANVPFPFVVNGKNLPAGKYTVQRDDTAPGILVVRQAEGKYAAAIVSTIPDSGKDPAGSKPALTFKRYENQYRLSNVWQADHEGWDLLGR
jgi:hypothetical protein